MNKVRTSFMETMLRHHFIGLTVYNEDNEPLVVNDLNFAPLTNQVFIKDVNGNGYVISVTDRFYMDVDTVRDNVVVTKGKLKKKG